ncbi:hypothetical protein JXM67_02135 [candidate division WOR-3 bacterium]|nr:hypothetical protein [candidate division WOR-3 bacterium]
MLLFALSIISSVEFPICNASGNQLYPDVCWDGESFWVVWQDGRSELSEIYAAKVDESGLSDEPFSVFAVNGNLRDPLIACGTDTFCLTFHSDVWTSLELPAACYVLLDEEGSAFKDIYYERIYDAGPITPVMCRDHFAVIANWGWNYGIEFPMEGEVGLLVEGMYEQILLVTGDISIFPYSSFARTGVWNGERLLCLTSAGYIWLEDTLNLNRDHSGYFFPRNPNELGWDSTYVSEDLLVIAMTRMDNRIGMIGRCDLDEFTFYFDLIDKNGDPVIGTPLFFNCGADLSWYRHTDMAYGNGRFVAVSGISVGDYSNREQTLWGTEIDTPATLVNEGVLYAGPREERDPAICFGSNHFLLVWADNRSGDWDIYGKILDSLEYSGVEEPSEPFLGYPTISIAHPAFTDKLEIRFSSPLERNTEIEIRDVLGRNVRSINLDAGNISYMWDGNTSNSSPAEAGVYFIRLHDAPGPGVKVIKF